MDTFKDAITAGLAVAARTTRADIAAGDSLPGQYVGTWVTIAAPDGYEAWCDTPGTLAIEVPVEHADTLVAWVEGQGIRCAQERGGARDDIATLHCNTRLAPVPPAPVEGGE